MATRSLFSAYNSHYNNNSDCNPVEIIELVSLVSPNIVTWRSEARVTGLD